MVADKKRAITEYLLAEIAAGRLASGDKAPTEIALAEKFKTSMGSAHRAMKELEAAGLFRRERRKGTFLADNLRPSMVKNAREESRRNIHLILPAREQAQAHWREATLLALESTVRAAGLKLVYHQWDTRGWRPDTLAPIIHKAIEQKARGIAISAVPSEIAATLGEDRRLIAENNVALYVHNITGEYVPDLRCAMVSPDPYADGAALGELARRSGYARIFFINSRDYATARYKNPQSWLSLRLDGLRFGLGAKDANAVTVVESDPERFAALESLRGQKENACAVAVNTRLGAGFIDAARELGMDCPRDFNLVAFDDHPDFLAYNLTALTAPLHRIGETFGRLIASNAGCYENDVVWVRVPYELTVRETFGMRKTP